MKKLLLIIIKSLVHLGAVSVVIWASLPVARWYLETRPLWGVDFYYTVTLVTFIRDNFTWLNKLWLYNWFGGWPIAYYSSILQYLFIIPLTRYWDVVTSVQIWMMISTGLFLVGVYALSVRLSGIVGLGVLVAVSAAWSVGVYGGLTWGGSLPAYATQAFYPWVLFFLVSYLQTKNKKALYFGSLLTGLSILAHPLIAIGYIFPTAGLLFLFYSGAGFKFFSKKKYSGLVLFLFLAFIIGFPLIYRSSGGFKALFVRNINSMTLSTVTVPEELNQDTVKFIREQPYRIYTDNHKLLFLLLGAGFVLFGVRLIFFSGRRASIAKVLPFLLIAGYYTGYIWIFAYGISIYHGGWYRLFWSVSVWVGALTAILFRESVSEVISRVGSRIVRSGLFLGLTIFMIVAGYGLWKSINKDFFERLVARSEYSSAFPGIINLGPVEKEKLIPSFMAGDDFQYRYYDSDATINIWFNSYFKRPLARGYFDPPITLEERSYLFLTDTSLSSNEGEAQLTRSFGFPPELSYNNALFFIDWNAIKYLGLPETDAAHSYPHASVIAPANIKNDEKIEYFEVYEQRPKEVVRFLEFKDELTSPIAQVTSVPAVGIFSSESGYEILMRNFAHMNLNSKKVIPVALGKSLDRVTEKQLAQFTAVILYEYDYTPGKKEKIVRVFENFLGKGGNVFVDTGSEVRDSASSEPLDFLPLTKSKREGLGSVWDFKQGETLYTKDIDFSSFGPPIFDEAQWSISYPESPGDLRDSAVEILKNKGKTVIALWQKGGKVIWSGVNLPYHVIRFNKTQEVEFLRKILVDLIGSTQGTSTSEGIKRTAAGKLVIEKPEGAGILVKEQFYDGWQARGYVAGRANGLTIYRAGPAYPGYMYIPLPEEALGKVEIEYKGSAMGIMPFVVSLIVVLWIIDAIMGINVFPWLIKRGQRLTKATIKVWWDRDTEE